MTIFALSSASGQSGVAVIRISGPETGNIIKSITNKDLPPPRKAKLLKINNINNSSLIDEGIILWFPAPNSYTGEDMAELHVHGSRGVITEIQNNLLSTKKCRMAEPGEFTKLAFMNGKINLDHLLATQPDLVIAFDLGGESSILDKIIEAGIPIVYNSDFLEETALGRAEWIKFFGYIFGELNLADSIFNGIVERYDRLKNLTQNVIERPSVFSGVVYGDTWFLPGGKNWSAQFIKDAGGTYIWGDNMSTGWLELSFETVLDRAREAEFWIGVASINTRAELMTQDSRYELFEAYQKQRIYNYNKRIGENGGFDFFESAYARPDLVLADLIWILHPELLPNHMTYYFQKIL